MSSATSNKRVRSEQSSACTECQRRKGKCIGGRPCTFCSKTGRKCIDQPQISRIPLTRKNMDDLHDRCQRLESLLRSIDPSIDIEDLLGGNLTDISRLNSRGGGGGGGHHDRTLSSGAESSGITTPDEVEENESENDEDLNPCKFEWHEGRDSAQGGMSGPSALADGMASLNIDSRDVGYLGRSSAAALLRHVYRLFKAHEQTTGRCGADFAYILASPLPSLKAMNQEKNLYMQWTEDSLVDAYFHYHHPSYPIIHEPIFRHKATRWKNNEIKVNSHWQTLYRMVLVCGAFYSCTDHTSSMASIDTEIYKKVNDSFFRLDFFSYGTLEGVQGLAIMGAYLQKRDNPNTGYNCLGMAVRMALGLGLHRDIAESKGNTLGMEIRRRVWWTLYIFDVGASITFGRPTITSDKIFTKIPSNVEDYHLTDLNAMLPPPSNNLTVYSAMIVHAHLVVLMNRITLNFFIHPRSLSSCRLPLTRELIAKFDEQVARWFATLPPYFSDDGPIEPWFIAPRAVLEWKAQNLRMLMYKCFLDCLAYSPRAFDREKPRNRYDTVVALDPEVRKCLGFALETLRSIKHFCETQQPIWHGVGWYATYYLFQAALILVTAILSVPRDASVDVWKDGVRDSLETLSVISTATVNAHRVAAVLNSCMSLVEEMGIGAEDVKSPQFNAFPTQPMSTTTTTTTTTATPASASAFAGDMDLAQFTQQMMHAAPPANTGFGQYYLGEHGLATYQSLLPTGSGDVAGPFNFFVPEESFWNGDQMEGTELFADIALVDPDLLAVAGVMPHAPSPMEGVTATGGDGMMLSTASMGVMEEVQQAQQKKEKKPPVRQNSYSRLPPGGYSLPPPNSYEAFG